jgi:hypothetical protein
MSQLENGSESEKTLFTFPALHTISNNLLAGTLYLLNHSVYVHIVEAKRQLS